MEENPGAIDVTLTTVGLKQIEGALSQIEIQGERLPEAALKMTGL